VPDIRGDGLGRSPDGEAAHVDPGRPQRDRQLLDVPGDAGATGDDGGGVEVDPPYRPRPA
jgi:hypothetical protein